MRHANWATAIALHFSTLGLPACTLMSDPVAFGGLHGDGTARQPDGAAAVALCLPVRTGELVINEILAKPAGIDLDGDGQSTGRDEALELVFVGDAPGHLDGAMLVVDGKLRGHFGDLRCLQPGQTVVVTGSTARDLQLPADAMQVRLSQPLELPDTGANLSVRGALATDLGTASYAKALPAQSWVRALPADRDAPFVPHPWVSGVGHSIGTAQTPAADPASRGL